MSTPKYKATARFIAVQGNLASSVGMEVDEEGLVESEEKHLSLPRRCWMPQLLEFKSSGRSAGDWP